MSLQLRTALETLCASMSRVADCTLANKHEPAVPKNIGLHDCAIAIMLSVFKQLISLKAEVRPATSLFDRGTCHVMVDAV